MTCAAISAPLKPPPGTSGFVSSRCPGHELCTPDPTPPSSRGAGLTQLILRAADNDIQPTPDAAESRTFSRVRQRDCSSGSSLLLLFEPLVITCKFIFIVRLRKAGLAHERAVSSILVRCTLGIVLLVRADLMAPVMRMPNSSSNAPTRCLQCIV